MSEKSATDLEVNQPLNTAERTEFKECEELISEHLDTFTKVGNALLVIRDKKLYREQFRTFEKYCEIKWGMTARRAYQLCEGATVVENLRTNGSQILPTNERQVRPLTKISPKEQMVVWTQAVESGPTQVTAVIVEEAVEKVRQVVNIQDSPELSPRRPEKVSAFQLRKAWQGAGKAHRETFLKWLVQEKHKYPEFKHACHDAIHPLKKEK